MCTLKLKMIFFFFNAIVGAFKFPLCIAFFSEPPPGGSFAVFFSFGSKLKHFPRTIGGGIGFGGHVVLNGLFMLVSFRKMMMLVMVVMLVMMVLMVVMVMVMFMLVSLRKKMMLLMDMVMLVMLMYHHQAGSSGPCGRVCSCTGSRWGGRGTSRTW